MVKSTRRTETGDPARVECSTMNAPQCSASLRDGQRRARSSPTPNLCSHILASYITPTMSVFIAEIGLDDD